MMIAGRPSLLLALPLLLFPIVGCDSTTGLDEMSLVSTWDGVGSLQTIDAGRGLKLLIGTHAGVRARTMRSDSPFRASSATIPPSPGGLRTSTACLEA